MANVWQDDEVIDITGNIDWEPLEDGRELPRGLSAQIILTVAMNADGSIFDIIDQDMI